MSIREFSKAEKNLGSVEKSELFAKCFLNWIIIIKRHEENNFFYFFLSRTSVSQTPAVFQVSLGANFPYPIQAANNNVGIAIDAGRIFIGFRSGFKI